MYITYKIIKKENYMKILMRIVCCFIVLMLSIMSCTFPSLDYETEEVDNMIMDDPYLEDQNIIELEPVMCNRNERVPAVGVNNLYFLISNTTSAGSNADYIYINFGSSARIRLNGLLIDGNRQFPRNYWINYDLTAWAANFPQDEWDKVSLETISTDGILIEKVEMHHSDCLILDYQVTTWLDSPNASIIPFKNSIAATKRRQVEYIHRRNPAINGAILELGKTDGCKYGNKYAYKNWCSEFASWCLRKAGWTTPTGNITNGVATLKNYFDTRGRLYTKYDIMGRVYIPRSGDYLAVSNDGHSCLFIHWVDSPDGTISGTTRFRTIEGSYSQAVRFGTRIVDEICGVGNAQRSLANVSYNKPTWQSSTYASAHSGLAVDLNTNGNYYANSVTHTLYDYEPWWIVDIQASKVISFIDIYNRTDCCSSRLFGFYVFFSETPFLYNDTARTLSQSGVRSMYLNAYPYPSIHFWVNDKTARYIKIQIPNRSEYLSLAEIIVVGD